jgi:hypothetical protein
MVDINLTSDTASGFKESDFNQLKDVLQDGGVNAVILTVSSGATLNDSLTVGSGATITGDITANNNIVMSGQASSAIFTLTDGATITPDFDNGPIQTVTLEGNRTLANPSNAKDGASYSIIVKQDTTGSRTLGYGANYKWASGTAPTLSLGSNAVDILTFISDGTNMYGVEQKDFR